MKNSFFLVSRISLLLLALIAFQTLNAQPPIVAVNEICAINNSIAPDSAGEFDDWVELYNNTGAPIDLGEFFLTDDHSNPTKWMFPEGTMIPANGYLIVWCDNDTFQPGVHAFFKLNGAGEQLMLSDPSVNMIDSITYPAQQGDTTFGKYPNGYGPYALMPPTFSATNSPGYVAVEGPIAEPIRAYPNPASGSFRVDLPRGYEGELRLTHVSGAVVDRRVAVQSTTFEWETGNLSPGMYFLSGEGFAPTPIIVLR